MIQTRALYITFLFMSFSKYSETAVVSPMDVVRQAKRMEMDRAYRPKSPPILLMSSTVILV